MLRSKKKREWFPTSVRLPADLRDDIDRERKKEQHTQSGFIVQILRKWQRGLPKEE